MIYQIGGRLKNLRKENHLSQQDLSSSLGMSQGLLSAIENGKSAISLSTVIKVCKHFNISTEWFISGMSHLNKEMERNDFMPLIDVDAVAGYISQPSNPDVLEDLGFYKIPGYTKGAYRIFEIHNDYMYPSLEDKDMVVCEEVKDFNFVEDGMMAVIVTASKLLVQRLSLHKSNSDVFLCSSDNEQYKSFELSKDEVKEIWRIKAKITNSFINRTAEQTKRLEHLEKEMLDLKQQFGRLLN